MLYRTHHHSFLFPFNPFSSSSPPSPLQAVDQGMESVETALKSSFRPGTAAKTAQFNQQAAFLDDLGAVHGQPNDDFSVDDLLDFSNEPLHEEEEEEKEQPKRQQQQKQNDNDNIVRKPCSPQNYTTPTNHSSIIDDFGSLIAPADDLESLEWLSHFVEDSFSGYSLTYPAGKIKPPVEARSEPETPVQDKAAFTTPVQTKARTKRTRAGMRVWSIRSTPLTESSSSSSSASSTTSDNVNPVQCADTESVKPPPKKQRKKPGNESGGGWVQQPRRCSHCGVQKTPQWRAGPLGAKTLCNACGVRYKSGRLLPEYRPACSPTFSTELHSNNHRKVLEMRRKKELEDGLAPPVQSF